MKIAPTTTASSRRAPTARERQRFTPATDSIRPKFPRGLGKVATRFAGRSRHIAGLRSLVRKILLLLAMALMALAVAQKPSMLLLCLMPTAMTASAVRLSLGLLAAIAIKACIPSLTQRSRTLLPGGWRTLLAVVLTVGLLVLLYSTYGSHAFRKLSADDVVMHKAYVTQLIGFTVLWLALLR